MTRPLLLAALVLSLLGALPACKCTPPDDGAGEATPEEGSPAAMTPEEPVTAVEPAIPVSPEVSALIEAGDVAAIAADMQARTEQMRALTESTEQRSKSLEEIAEEMTGRNNSVDLADPATVELLQVSADKLAAGAAEMATDVAKLRQLVVDLKAEAEAIHGAPATSGS